MDRSLEHSAFDEAIAEISGRLEQLSPFQTKQLEKFMLGAQQMGPTGNGNSIRTRLLGLSNHAYMANLSEEECFAILRKYVHGDREVDDYEIWGVIEKAWYDHEDEDHDESKDASESRTRRPNSPRKVRNKKVEASPEHVEALLKFRDELIEAGEGTSIKQIMERSPNQLSMKPKAHLIGFLEALYRPEDILYMGGTYGRHVFTARDQMQRIQVNKDLSAFEYIIPNPFSGEAMPIKSGTKKSRRCDAAVWNFKYAIAEFDHLSLEEQLAFWGQIDLPIVALIYSGGKSIHAWVKVEVSSEDEWNVVVREQLYGQFLIPMGVDRSCRNPSRLSRTPGHHREGKKDQHCFYLAPEGKAVFA